MGPRERAQQQDLFDGILRSAGHDPQFAQEMSSIAKMRFNERHYNYPYQTDISYWSGRIFEEQENPNYATRVLHTAVAYPSWVLNGPYDAVIWGIRNGTSITESELAGAIVIVKDANDRRNPLQYERRHGVGSMDLTIDPASHPDRWMAELGLRMALDPYTWIGLGMMGRTDDAVRAATLADDSASGAASIDDYLRAHRDFEKLLQSESKFADAVEGVRGLNAPKSAAKITAPIDFDGHILNAEVKANGSVVGGHSTGTGQVQVIEGTASAPNASGVYRAKIKVADPNNPGQFVPKTNNGGWSTMFPDSWSADRVKIEVDAAFQNRTVNGNKWSGTTPSGVRVEGYLQPKTTVYPIY